MWYHTLNEALRSQFGGKVYKLALDGGMGCPNRDGTCGTRGCIFCSEQGSGDFAAPHCADLAAQLSRAKARVAQKAPDARYIAYFQSFTNTYAPTAYLEAPRAKSPPPDRAHSRAHRSAKSFTAAGSICCAPHLAYLHYNACDSVSQAYFARIVLGRPQACYRIPLFLVL